MKLTPWYPPHIKPVRVGVYETEMYMGDIPGKEAIYQGFSNWNGLLWSSAFDHADTAAQQPCNRADFQNKSWRGLAEEPKA